MTTAVSANVCDLSLIYSDTFTYSLPQEMLKSYLDGKAFDHKESYTADERSRLEQDINELYTRILAENPAKEKEAVLTAGAPGAGKTTLMEQLLAKESKKFAYIDPDAVCLKTAMSRTYQTELQAALSDLDGKGLSPEERSTAEKAIRKAAYDKWRPGSNAATHIILANLIRENRALYFGTTATSPQVSKFFDFLKKNGYQIHIIHLSAPDDVRWGSIQERDKTFVQTTEADTINKGKELPQRIKDYLKAADVLSFYYRDGVEKDAELVVTRIKHHKEKVLDMYEPFPQKTAQYAAIRAIHNATCEALGKPELSWENTVDKIIL